MKLVSYTDRGSEGPWRAGILLDRGIVDVDALSPQAASTSVRSLLALRADARAELLKAAEGAPVVDDPVVGPPVPDPDKIICLGLNYRAHAAESNMEAPAAPILFAKFRNALIGPDAPIPLPAASKKVDYEGELAVVIGKRAKHVSESDALGYIGGYMIMNDISARDLQLQTPQWTTGKAIDGFAPCGPALVTSDEIVDPQSLQLTTRLNGEVVQQASTASMIFSIAYTVAFISQVITLEVGDIIATGTPEGVGATRTPPVFLQDGDEIEVEVSKVGVLKNPVVAESRTDVPALATEA